MRWESSVSPKLGDTRIVSRFLLFPVDLQGETRWLEWAKIKQVLTLIALYDGARGWSWEHAEWSWEHAEWVEGES